MMTVTEERNIVDTKLDGVLDSSTTGQNNTQLSLVCDTQEDFVSRVIFDGRYLDTFTEKPEETAEHLGVTINATIANQLRGRDPMPILSATTSLMTEERAKQQKDALPHQPQMGFGLIVIVAIVIDRVAEPACKNSVYPCEDLSDNADEKL